MTAALCSYPKDQRTRIALNRIKADVGGLGTLAARDYEAHILRGTIDSKETEQLESVPDVVSPS